MIISLKDMKRGEEGVVAEITGGMGAAQRIRSMGIRIGKKIKKGESHFWRGPQTIIVDNFKVALGFGMALKIMVEVERVENK